jgi:hypothetical protein
MEEVIENLKNERDFKMSIESNNYKCRVCSNLSETPYIKVENVFEPRIHLCSTRCFKLFQVILGQKAKVQKEANQIITKKVTFEKDRV